MAYSVESALKDCNTIGIIQDDRSSQRFLQLPLRTDVDMRRLKDELIDCVSAFLLKEPSYERECRRLRGETPSVPRSRASIQNEASEVERLSLPASPQSRLSASLPTVAVDVDKTPQRVMTPDDVAIARIRYLVHIISASDGEFVLKLALYLRHELNIRRTPNFLTALCAREKNCLPFLAAYMKRIIRLPSDWLSIANYAYFHDSDSEHWKLDHAADIRAVHGKQPHRRNGVSNSQQRERSISRPPSQSTTVPSELIADPTPSDTHRGTLSLGGPANPPTRHRTPTRCNITDTDRQRLPSALRHGLVMCFKMFDEFSLAKYNNEGAVRRKNLRGKNRRKRVLDQATAGGCLPGDNSDEPDEGDEAMKRCCKNSSKLCGERADAMPSRPLTFTYKRLIRMLHISEPCYSVACLLGKRHPASEDEFEAMGLGRDGRHSFDPALAGTRMRLPIPDTWETRVSKDGNRAAVWDDLVARDRVPFMAMLRNLRNMVACHCKKETHLRNISRLTSEEQVAACRLFPYRFYSAFSALSAAREDIRKAELRRQEIRKMKESETAPSKFSTMGNDNVRRRHHQRQHRLPPPLENRLNDLVQMYTQGLEAAIQISTKVNIIPVRGASVVVLCLRQTLLNQVKAVGGGPIGSVRTKLELAVLLAVMMKYACEACTVLLYCFDKYVVFEAENSRTEGIMNMAQRMVTECEAILLRESLARRASVSPPEGHVEVFPYTFFDRVVESRARIASLIVIDEGHHTYSLMNKVAPSLGDLPVYLDRMRRAGSDDLIYVGVSLSHVSVGHASPSSASRPTGNLRSGEPVSPLWPDASPSLSTDPRVRFSHRNDILVTGFSDAILRLVAERSNGGTRHFVERAHEAYNVSTAFIRLENLVSSSRSKISKGSSAERKSKKPFKQQPVLSREGKKTPKRDRGIQSPVSSETTASSTGESTMGLSTAPISKSTRTVASSGPCFLDIDGFSNNCRSELAVHPPVPTTGDFRLLRGAFPQCGDVFNLSPCSVNGAFRIGDDGANLTPRRSKHVVAHPTPFVTLKYVPRDNSADRGSNHRFPVPQVCRPLTSYRECRFFISSTFLDMSNERSALVLDVFPRVRRWAAEMNLRVSLIEIDLRWGITKASTDENLSTSVCLNEVSRCSPFFIGILGARYGFCPNPIYVTVGEDNSLEEYEWLKDLDPSQEGKVSTTELEMRHGIYNARRCLGLTQPPSVVFFSREYDALLRSLPDDASKAAYGPDSDSSLDRIDRLKEYVEANNISLISYQATFAKCAVEPCAPPVGNADPLALGTWPYHAANGVGTSAIPHVNMNTLKPERTLVSDDVPLDMTDFSDKAYRAIRAIVAQVSDVPLPAESTEELTAPSQVCESGDGDIRQQWNHTEDVLAARPRADTATCLHRYHPIPSVLRGTPPADFYAALSVDMNLFMGNLLRLYVPPHGVVERLAGFALTGYFETVEDDTSKARAERHTAASANEEAQWQTLDDDRADTQFGLKITNTTPNVLVLEGNEGNGKSSAMAALTERLLSLPSSQTAAVYYFMQASDGTLRSLILYLCTALLSQVGLQEQFNINEGDTVANLLRHLSLIYAAVKECRASVVVLLDGLDRFAEASELLHHFGSLVSAAATPEIRFVMTCVPGSVFASALSSRVPPAYTFQLPLLSLSERADVIRRHLDFYGKQLQETVSLSEIKGLLRKKDGCHASYLIFALMHLRLFSCFSTLHEDIYNLPGGTAQLCMTFFNELERRFGVTTCRLTLTTLYLRQEVGGIMEYNLYRLVGHVAGVTQLVALLQGTCLVSRKGRLLIANSFFEVSVGNKYLPTVSDLRLACENLVAAELLYRPLSADHDSVEVRGALRAVVESIQRCALDPMLPCLFHPSRHAPRELLGILKSAVRARRYDVAATLSAYLPFLEMLLKDRGMLRQLISLLSIIVASGSLSARLVAPLPSFLLKHHYILCENPRLLRQCILNAPPTFRSISRYSSDLISRLHSVRSRPGDLPAPCEGGLVESTADYAPEAACNEPWVRWVNRCQHGGESRLSVYHPANVAILCMASSKRGDVMAMGGADGVVRVACTPELDSLTALLQHEAPVTALAFLLCRDNILVSGCARGLLYVWNIDDNCLLQLGSAHYRCITTIVCHPEEYLVCTGGHDSYCMLWDILGHASSISTTINVAKAKREEEGNIYPKLRRGQAAIPMRGKSQSGTRPSNLRPFEIFRHHDAPVAAVAFHQSGAILATGAWDGQVHLITLRPVIPEPTSSSGSILPTCRLTSSTLSYERTCINVGSAVRALALAPTMVVTCAVGTYNGSISIIDHASGSESARMESGHPNSPITALMFSPNGRFIASSNEQGQIKVSYAGVTGTQVCSMKVHRKTITSILFSKNQDAELLTASEDQTIQMWQIGEKTDVPSSHSTTVTAIAVATDGSLFVTGCADGTALVFTTTAEDTSEKFGLGGKEGNGGGPPCLSPSFSLTHDGHRISCLTVGLANTRILVGVAFGFVYVWSSLPGLNRTEGRLLQRVRVSLEGVYPVVHLECRDCVAHSSLEDRSGLADSHPSPGPLRNASDDSNVQGVCSGDLVPRTARVTALCSNSDAAHFDIFSDAVWMTLQRARSQACTSAASEAREDVNALIPPCAARHSYVASDNSLSNDDDEDVVCMRVERQRFTWLQLPPPVSSQLPSSASERESHAETIEGIVSRASSHSPASTSREQEHYTNVKDHVAILGEELIGAIQLRYSESTQQDADRSVPAAEESTHPTQQCYGDGSSGHSECDYPLGEAVPLSSPVDPSHPANEKHLVDGTTDSENSLAGTTQSVMAAEHCSLLVGTKRFYLGLYLLNCIIALPVYKDYYLCLREEVFSPTFSLEEDEVFVHASHALWPAHSVEGMNSDPKQPGLTQSVNLLGLIAFTTSKGKVMLFHLEYCAKSDDTVGSAPDALETGATTPMGPVTQYGLQALQKRVTLTLWWQTCLASGLDPVTVESLDLQVEHKSRESSVTAGTVQILVGCGDGSIRWWTSDSLLRRTPMRYGGSRRAVITNDDELDEKLSFGVLPCGRKDSNIPSTEVEGPQTHTDFTRLHPLNGAEGEAGIGERPQSTLKLNSHLGCFSESGLFYATSAVTALRWMPNFRTGARPIVPYLTTSSGMPHETNVTASEDCAAPTAHPFPRLRWLAGDQLGNIYQLSGEVEDPRDVMLASTGRKLRVGEGYSCSDACSRALQLLQLHATQDASVGGVHAGPASTTEAENSPSGLQRGWAWHSSNPVEWQQRVDFTEQLQTVLRTVPSRPPSVVDFTGSSIKLARSGVPNSRDALLGADASLDVDLRFLPSPDRFVSDSSKITTALAATTRLVDHLSRDVSLLSRGGSHSSTNRGEDVVHASGPLLTRPPTVFDTAFVKAPPALPSFGSKPSGTSAMQFPAIGGPSAFPQPLGANRCGTPSAEPMLSYPEQYEANDSGRDSSFRGCQGNERTLPSREGPTPVRCAIEEAAHQLQVPPLQSHTKSSLADRSPLGLRNVPNTVCKCIASAVSSQKSELRANDIPCPSLSELPADEGTAYFEVLGKAMPPGMPGADRRQWLQHQQEVFIEAMRVQRYNIAARKALQAYSQAAAATLE